MTNTYFILEEAVGLSEAVKGYTGSSREIFWILTSHEPAYFYINF